MLTLLEFLVNGCCNMHEHMVPVSNRAVCAQAEFVCQNCVLGGLCLCTTISPFL